MEKKSERDDRHEKEDIHGLIIFKNLFILLIFLLFFYFVERMDLLDSSD